MFFSPCTSPLEPFEYPPWADYGVRVFVKRDDRLHPQISGNKGRKLKYNLAAAKAAGCTRLLSFGGAWSNHLHALAFAAKAEGFTSVGWVRADEGQPLTPTLQDCQAWGMQLHFLSRADYRRRDEPAFLAELAARCGGGYWLPEGGSNALAVRGIAEGVAEVCLDYDVFACAVGSGATLAGIAAGLGEQQRAIGIAVLKQGDYLRERISALLAEAQYPPRDNWQLRTEFHGGGYAKCSPSLRHFCEDVAQKTGLPLEPVYTGKLFYAVGELLRSGEISAGTRLVLLHTGGLQGLRGFL